MSIVRLVVEDKPLVLLGLPGARASVAFVLIGVFCLPTTITLYAITRLARKVNNRASK